MHKSLFAMLVSLGLMGCFPDPPDGGGGGGGGTPDAGGVDPCIRKSAGSGGEGFPFDGATFDSMIYTPLKGCEIGSSCHGVGNPNRFTVFSTGNCPENQTFNEVFNLSDLTAGGAGSRMVQAIDGTLAAHPIKPPNTDSLVMALTSYIDTAKTTLEMGGGGGGDGGVGGGGGSFDQTMYANLVHPVLSNSGCINTGCHNIDQGSISGDFALHPRALAGSTELTENIATIAMRIDTSLPAAQADTTVFYDYCTNSHAGAVVGNTQAIEDWIATGLVQ